MVILAMHVSRNRSAKRNEARARSDRRKKTARQKHIDQFRDRDASLASQKPRGGIEREHSVEPRKIDHPILIVKRRIAISPPGPPRDQRRRVAGDNGLQLGDSIRPINIALGKRIPPPPGKHRVARKRRRSSSRRHSEKPKVPIEANRKIAIEKRAQARTTPTLHLRLRLPAAIAPIVLAKNARTSLGPLASISVRVVDVLRYFGVIAFDFRRDLTADVFDVILVHYRHIDLDFVRVVVIEFDAGDLRDLR